MNIIHATKPYISMKNKNNETIILGFIILAGAALRLWHYMSFSYINDELSALTRTHYSSFSELIEKGVKTDVHPIFEQGFLFYWTKIFGYDVAMVRLPFILIGIACIPLIYSIGKRWFNSSAGLFAAAMFAILRYPIYYTQQARPYAFGLFFTLAAVYYWSKILFPTEDEEKLPFSSLRKYFIGFILFTVFAWYTHYYTFLITGITFISGFFFIKRNLMKYYLLSGVAVALLYIPHINIFLLHLSLGGVGGKGGYLGKPESDFMIKHLLLAFNNSELTLLCVGAFLLLSILLRINKITITRFHILAILFFALPLLTGYAYSVLRNPVLQNAVPVFSFPYLLLFLGSFLPLKAPKPVAIAIIAALFMLCIYTTKNDNKNYRGGFKFIAEKTVEYDKQLGEHNYLKVLNIVTAPYINYYLERMNHPTTYSMYNVFETADIVKLQTMLDTSHSQYFLYGYESCQNPHETEPLIRSQFPIVVEDNTFYVSGITLYKRSTDPAQQYLPVKEFTSNAGEAFVSANPTPITMINDTASQNTEMNEQKEFSATFNSSIADLRMPDSSDCYFSVWVKSEGALDGAQLVLSFERNGASLDWVGADMKLFVKSPGIWQKVIIARKFPKNVKPADTIKAYVWNPDKKIFLVHGLDLKIFPPNKK